MQVGDLVRYKHSEDRRLLGDLIGLVVKKFQRNTTVLWQGQTGWEECIDGWILEVVNENTSR